MTDQELTALLTQNSYGGLPKEQAQAVLLSLRNQLRSDPTNVLRYQSQLQEMFGGDITQQVMSEVLPDIQGTQLQTQTGASAPTPTTVGDLLAAPPDPTGLNMPNVVGSQDYRAPGQTDQLPVQNTSLDGLGPRGSEPTYGTPSIDVERILAEADLAKKSQSDLLLEQDSARRKYLTDLSGILQEQQRNQLSSEMPGIYEDLNTRGLLRSSDLGNRLSLRQSELAKITSGELARQGLAYSDQYTTGLGDINNNYLGARQSALQRRFNLQDYDTNIRASKELGFALQPAPQSSGGKGTTGLNAGLAGAAIGSKFGPVGAVVGGAGGMAAGSGK